MLAYCVVWHMRQAVEPLLTEADGCTSLPAILATLGTIERHTMEARGYRFTLVTEPDALQHRILTLLDVPIPASPDA